MCVLGYQSDENVVVCWNFEATHLDILQHEYMMFWQYVVIVFVDHLGI